MKKTLVIIVALLLHTTLALAIETFHVGYLDENNNFVANQFLWNNELRPIPSDAAAFQIQGAAQGSVVDPVSLFIGIAFQGSSFTAPVIDNLIPYGSPALGVNIAGNYRATLTSSSADAYTLLGLGGANNSQNWSNWSGAYNDLIGPMDANGYFGIFEYKLFGTGLTGNQHPVGVEFSGDLPQGAYIFGYARFEKDGRRGAILTDFHTPFTETGMTPPAVPEPGSMALLGAGLMIMAIFGKRRMANS